MEILYPLESVPITWHIMIMGVGTALTVLGLFAAYKWRNIKDTGTWKDVLKDIIPLGGIILALASPLVASVFGPILDYNVTEGNKTNTIDIKISNVGFKSAENIQTYLKSENLNFVKMASKPFIFNGTISILSDKLEQGKGLFYISSLPSKSQTVVEVTTKQDYTNTDKITVYVRSEEASAFHGLFSVSMAYLALALILVFNSVYLISKNWGIRPKQEEAVPAGKNPNEIHKFYLAYANIGVTVLIFLILYLGTCDGIIPGCRIDPTS